MEQQDQNLTTATVFAFVLQAILGGIVILILLTGLNAVTPPSPRP